MSLSIFMSTSYLKPFVLVLFKELDAFGQKEKAQCFMYVVFSLFINLETVRSVSIVPMFLLNSRFAIVNGAWKHDFLC